MHDFIAPRSLDLDDLLEVSMTYDHDDPSLRTGKGGLLLRVAGVGAGSRAERAGLRGGDEIVAINGRAVAEIPMAELRQHMGAAPLSLTVKRDGETLELAVPDR